MHLLIFRAFELSANWAADTKKMLLTVWATIRKVKKNLLAENREYDY